MERCRWGLTSVVDVHRVDLEGSEFAYDFIGSTIIRCTSNGFSDDGADGSRMGKAEGNIGHEDAIHDVNV